jgi:hypothetical protein
MKRKPIRIDWDDLESAFDNKNADLVYYVDRITGHVLLEGEGEEADFDDDEEHYDRPTAPAPAPATDATRAYIERLTDDEKLDWIERFVQEADDLETEFSTQLDEALSAEDPVPAVIEVLNQFPEGKDRWYQYRTDRLHEMIEAWLERQGIAYTDPPPWN